MDPAPAPRARSEPAAPGTPVAVAAAPPARAERLEALGTWLAAALLLLLAVANAAPRFVRSRERVEVHRPVLHVQIEGAVARPGAYDLPWGATVGDLVDAAGGLSAGAERSLVALAAPLTAGGRVVVPSRAPEGSGAGGATPAAEERVDVNSAPPAALEALPGIGPALAARIVAGRPYHAVEDLLRVPGIGERTLERLRPRVGL